MNQSREDILHGWKDIARYVGRDIRTVERWEKQRNLPIRRVPGEGRATVYALASELDEWFRSTSRDKTQPNGSGDWDEPADAEQQIDSSNGEAEITAFSAAGGNGAHRSSPRMEAGSHSDTAQHMSGARSIVAASTTEAAVTPAARRNTKHARAWAIAASIAALAAAAASGALVMRSVHRSRTAANAMTSAAGHTGGPTRYRYDMSQSAGVPYASRVAGVDDLCLRGVYSYEQRTEASLKYSVQYFSQAIAKDPGYAPAYSGLANAYILMREYSVLSDEQAYARALAASQKAVQLDPNLADAHAALGFIDFFWLADPVTAEKEFRTALRISPGSVTAHHWYGSVLTHEGRYKEALEQLDLAQRLEPTSAAIFSSRALALGLSGRRNEAVDMLQELLDEAPDATSPHQILAILSLVPPRDMPRWLDESRRVNEMRHNEEQLRMLKVGESAYRSGGEKAVWAGMVKDYDRATPAGSPRPFAEGTAAAAMGDFDKAYAILEPLASHHRRETMTIAMDPLLTEFRSDPRFQKLLAQTGVPAAQQVH